MQSLAILAAFLLAVLVAWACTGLVRRHALQNAMLDIPNSRSSHDVPTARGGGLAIVLVFVPCLLLLWFLRLLDFNTVVALIAGGAAVAVIGYLDDRNALRARVRFGVHLAAAIWVVALLGGLNDQSLRMFGMQGVVAGSAIAVLALAWMTNLFNFMDGIDGIAASEAIFIASAASWLCWRHGPDTGLTLAMLALAGSTSGFLIWNWPPARIFMGDVGSGFLGFSLAALAIAATRRGCMPIEAWVILGGVFLVDATLTLARRVLRGDRWFEPHRSHAYQHIKRRWKGHLPVTMAVIAIDVLWLLPWAWLATSFQDRAPWFLAAALIPLALLALAAGAGRREG